MTENYPTGTTPPPAGVWPETEQEQDTSQLVKDQASDLANSGVQAGKHVGDVAREQASGVAAEAGLQGRTWSSKLKANCMSRPPRGSSG